ncbi:MAG: hypothetical protein ACKOSQ_08295 [Planctomycetaceae bacterium]
MRAAAGHLPRKTARGLAACVLALAGPGPINSVAGEPAAPVHALWNGLPLRAWAERATTLAGRPVVVDRRLDPDTAVTRDCRGEPLGDVLATVAESVGGTVEPLRSWIRIGPTAAAGRATQGEADRLAEIAALPEAARTALATRRAWSWADGARPRELVAAAAAAEGATLAGLEKVPHDHLPAATLPPLGLAERLDLVLAHHDLRIAWAAEAGAGPTGNVVPLPAAGRVAAAATGGRERPTKRQGPRSPRVTERFTLRLEAPLDEAIGSIAPRLGLEPALDRESLAARGILPGEIVRAAVTDATRDELLDALVAPLGLRWRIEEGRLVVDAPPP